MVPFTSVVTELLDRILPQAVVSATLRVARVRPGDAGLSSEWDRGTHTARQGNPFLWSWACCALSWLCPEVL